jgi:hypothetical protein
LPAAARGACQKDSTGIARFGQRDACSKRGRPAITVGMRCAAHQLAGEHNVADEDKRWQDMNPDEQAVVIRQINGAVNGLQFRVQDLEDAVKTLQERLKR